MQKVVKGEFFEKPIERLATSTGDKVAIPGTPEQVAKRERIGRRAAKEIHDGMYVNLGIGIPTITCNFIPDNISYKLHGENGLLGIGPYPRPG